MPEHALDIRFYEKNLGVGTDGAAGFQPDTGEQALEITEILVLLAPTKWLSLTQLHARAQGPDRRRDGDSHMGLQV